MKTQCLNKLFCQKSVALIEKIMANKESRTELNKIYDTLTLDLYELQKLIGKTKFRCISGDFKGRTLTVKTVKVAEGAKFYIRAAEYADSRINFSEIELYTNSEGETNLFSLGNDLTNSYSDENVEDTYWTEPLKTLYPELTAKIERSYEQYMLEDIKKNISSDFDSAKINIMKKQVELKNDTTHVRSIKTGHTYRVVDFNFDFSDRIELQVISGKSIKTLPMEQFEVLDNVHVVVDFVKKRAS